MLLIWIWQLERRQALLLEWKKHRVLLSRVDAGKAPDINWPQSP
ncbi:TPA: tail fiber assembly protein [Enterobacter chengduensis]|nr:tail fiber assembly protein [Enterobacter chengduensis]MDI6554949.1 tail fiber assembly protein [Enterobacter chengduensis]